MKKHRPRIRKTKQRNRKPQTTIVGTPNNGEPVVYHGGAPFLKVGEYILPRAVTGETCHAPVRSEGSTWHQLMENKEDFGDGDWIYVTESFPLAAFHACKHKSGCGMVYRVVPEGDEAELDPDREFDCYRVRRARIVAIEKIPFQLRQKIKSYALKAESKSYGELMMFFSECFAEIGVL